MHHTTITMVANVTYSDLTCYLPMKMQWRSAQKLVMSSFNLEGSVFLIRLITHSKISDVLRAWFALFIRPYSDNN